MKKIIPTIFSLLVSLLVLSQNVEFKSKNFPNQKDELKAALEHIKTGDKILEKGAGTPAAFMEALPFYLRANQFNPNNVELNLKIATAYYETERKAMSAKHFAKVTELTDKFEDIVLFYLADAQQANLEFEKAIANFEKFRNKASGKDMIPYKDKIPKRIEECRSGIQLVAKPIKIRIENVGAPINTSFPEYVPIITADESQLIFTSRRDNLIPKGEIFPFEDIFISKKEKNGNWGTPKKLPEPVNRIGEHNASVTVSPDGQKMIVYKYINEGDLFETELDGEIWTEPKSLGKNINSKYRESHASYAPDGKTIYFTSDRPGGKGGMDIYMSTKNDKGEWGAAVNIGDVINTPYDEDAVFAHPDGKTLYFSSKGHNTMGGFDIFKSEFKDGKWSKPVNLGYPLNTPGDDIFLVVSANGRIGYYATEFEDSKGSRDIYRVVFVGADKSPVVSLEERPLASLSGTIKQELLKDDECVNCAELTLLKGIITNMENKPLEAYIEIVNNQTGEIIFKSKSNKSTGAFLVTLPSGTNYGISVNADGYLFHSENFNIPQEAKYKEVEKHIKLQNYEVGSTIVLRNIFFEFGKSTLTSESTTELERVYKVLKENPNIKIEISGHTDNVGSAAFNKSLSNARAKAVVDYLIGKGISADRMTSKGYGFEKPMATNDTDEGRALNRRTEFTITSK